MREKTKNKANRRLHQFLRILLKKAGKKTEGFMSFNFPGNFLPASQRVFLPAAAGGGQFIGSDSVFLTGELNSVK